MKIWPVVNFLRFLPGLIFLLTYENAIFNRIENVFSLAGWRGASGRRRPLRPHPHLRCRRHLRHHRRSPFCIVFCLGGPPNLLGGPPVAGIVLGGGQVGGGQAIAGGP